MNSYTLAIGGLLVGLLAQSLAIAVAAECFLRKGRPALARRSWLAVAIAALIFALQHAFALELAVRTGLHDVRQALLAASASALLALAVYGFRRLA